MTLRSWSLSLHLAHKFISKSRKYHCPRKRKKLSRCLSEGLHNDRAWILFECWIFSIFFLTPICHIYITSKVWSYENLKAYRESEVWPKFWWLIEISLLALKNLMGNQNVVETVSTIYDILWLQNCESFHSSIRVTFRKNNKQLRLFYTLCETHMQALTSQHEVTRF